MKRTLSIAGVTLLAVVLLCALVVGSGALSVAADEPHSSLVFRILETARDRSIEAHADDVQVPGLEDPAMLRRGAGNYDAMCAKCHLAPGMQATELSAGLSPNPPNLAQHADADAAEAFWVIKHGIKATGMPAWGKHMQDQYIWEVVAFLRKLPSLSAEQYHSEVEASGGHSHGGGESAGHSHEAAGDHDEESSDHHHPEEAEHAASDAAASTHVHADGTTHVHSAPADDPVAAAKALHEAMSAGDAARVQSLLDPRVIIMEGGSVERSLKEYASHHLPADLKFLKGLTYRLERQTGGSSGDLAWVAGEAVLTGTSEGKPVDLISTETLVLQKFSGNWRVTHIHWSSRAARKKA